MILTILKTALSSVQSSIKWITEHYNLVAAVALSVATAIIFKLLNKISYMDADIDRLNHNIEFYQELNDSILNDNKLLVLTVEDLLFSKDSIVRLLYNTKKELNIKDKHLKAALSLKLDIQLDTTIIVKEPEFDKIIKPNALTCVRIIKKDSTLLTILDILNTQSLYLSSKRIYKRKYKNWFKRLLHFDFKKTNDYRYNIVNSNELIKVTDTRLIKVSE